MFYIDLLKSLYDNNIEYLIVGGVAVNLHGVPRATFDFDLVISTDKSNILALLKVLGEGIIYHPFLKILFTWLIQ
jgi:hypothetical protein